MAGKTDDQERKLIESAIGEEISAVEDADIDRYLAVLTDDALFLPPGLPSIGGEKLRTWLREFLDQWNVEWLGFHHNEIEIAGDIAFHRYSYSWRLEPKGGGELQVAHGKGLHILRRDPRSGWKIAREIWNDRPTPNNV